MGVENCRAGGMKKAAETLRRLDWKKMSCEGRKLSAQADTHTGEGAIEADIFFLRRIDASIHRAEEEVTAITQTDFGVRILEG